MTSRAGDWMQTYTGRVFWPIDPRPEEVCHEDVAHALALQCRYAGHVKIFYSVAEHSVRVSREVERLLRGDGTVRITSEAGRRCVLAALLHDAAEAYCVDLPRPIKRYSALGREYQKVEGAVHIAVFTHFGLDPDLPPLIHEVDDVLLMTEMRDLMASPPQRWKGSWTLEPLAEVIRPLTCVEAEAAFLTRIEELRP